MPEKFRDKLDYQFGFLSPRKRGFDTSARFAPCGTAMSKFFVEVRGNFVWAAPDPEVTELALARVAVRIFTKLNHSHVSTGGRAMILPTASDTPRRTPNAHVTNG